MGLKMNAGKTQSSESMADVKSASQRSYSKEMYSKEVSHQRLKKLEKNSENQMELSCF